MCHSVITVGIVLFNPNDDKRFLRCIQSVLSQVDNIYIVVPRQHEFGEHVKNHQVEFVKTWLKE